MAREWNIRPRGRRCAACDTAFADGQDCVSALFETATSHERRDFCLPCWQVRAGAPAPFSVWQGTFAAPPAAVAGTPPLRRETAESLLRRLMALEDPANSGIVYILAVMLERKRVLVERDARPRPEGGVLRVYEHRRSGETFVILDPCLRLDEIGELQRQVIGRLGAAAAGNGPPAADVPPAAAETPPRPREAAAEGR
jgi:hypothetical protein